MIVSLIGLKGTQIRSTTVNPLPIRYLEYINQSGPLSWEDRKLELEPICLVCSILWLCECNTGWKLMWAHENWLLMLSRDKQMIGHNFYTSRIAVWWFQLWKHEHVAQFWWHLEFVSYWQLWILRVCIKLELHHAEHSGHRIQVWQADQERCCLILYNWWEPFYTNRWGEVHAILPFKPFMGLIQK